MLVPFDTISPSSRLWIYQSAKAFSESDIVFLDKELKAFTNSWEAHGQPLQTSYAVMYNHFILLAVDESHYGASGCSIDGSVRVIKNIEAALSINLFDRTQVAFKETDHIYFIPTSILKQNFIDGMWNENTLTFNNVITQMHQLKTEWVVPAGSTWLKRYVTVETPST